MTESALDSPYAVASTTFPNAPDPSVFPARTRPAALLNHPGVSLPRQAGLLPGLELPTLDEQAKPQAPLGPCALQDMPDPVWRRLVGNTTHKNVNSTHVCIKGVVLG